MHDWRQSRTRIILQYVGFCLRDSTHAFSAGYLSWTGSTGYTRHSVCQYYVCSLKLNCIVIFTVEEKGGSEWQQVQMDQELYCIQRAKDVTVASWQMADAVAVNSGQIILKVWRHIKNLTVSRLHRNLSLVFHFLVLCFPLSDNRYYRSCFFRSSNFKSSIFSTPHHISSRSDYSASA